MNEKCIDCGFPLNKDEKESGRDMCFECYYFHND